jgi:hypothetical protein
MLPALGHAEVRQLRIVEVSFPAVNCIFSVDCRIVVDDSSGDIAMPFLTTPGTAWLQSRTFLGQARTIAVGQTGYMYRISLTQASGQGECLAGFTIDFGPITRLPYVPGQPEADVFVGSLGGGLGTIGLASAEQDGDVITFTLRNALCVPPSPTVNATTYFIGLASEMPPMAVNATVFGYGTPPIYSVQARGPQRQ